MKKIDLNKYFICNYDSDNRLVGTYDTYEEAILKNWKITKNSDIKKFYKKTRIIKECIINKRGCDAGHWYAFRKED